MIDREAIKQKYIQSKDLLKSKFSSRYLDIFEFRWGLLDGVTHTLEETGKRLGVTRERIRQMEAKLLDELNKLST